MQTVRGGRWLFFCFKYLYLMFKYLAERRGSFRLLVARDDPDGVEVRWPTR